MNSRAKIDFTADDADVFAALDQCMVIDDRQVEPAVRDRAPAATADKPRPNEIRMDALLAELKMLLATYP